MIRNGLEVFNVCLIEAWKCERSMKEESNIRKVGRKKFRKSQRKDYWVVTASLVALRSPAFPTSVSVSVVSAVAA